MPRSALVVPVAVAGLVISACSGSSGSSSGHPRYAANGTFTIALRSDLGSFDPYNDETLGYAPLAYDSLVNLRPDGTIVSGLAQKWAVDARSATFTLRAGVTCSDGTALTARQVADDINVLSDPTKTKLYGELTPTIPFSATADDASRTVRVVVKSPFGFLLRSIGLAPIVCSKGLKDPKMFSNASDGTGPFVLTKVVRGQSYTFTVRKGYTWGPGGASTSAPGTPSTVVLKVVTNQTTAANLLLSGQLNMAQVGGTDQQRLEARHLGTTKYHTGLAIWFNQIGNRPTTDARVRQALEQAVDHAALIKVSTAGRGEPATGLLALDPRTCAADTVDGHIPTHDPAAAEALLDQAGWTRGADGIRTRAGRPLALDLHYLTDFDPLDGPTAELLAQQWKAIGVKVTLSGDDTVKTTDVLYKNSNWDTDLSGYGFFLPTQWVSYASGPTPPNGANISGIHNAAYKRLAAQAAGMVPPQACTTWNQAEQELMSDSDILPISFRATTYYLQHAQAKVIAFQYPIPTSIRVLR